ncbi:MAG TPA: hypothetical protein VGO67_11585 [Verrucomicrobiae bacterium]|jgi:hypothetical protein
MEINTSMKVSGVNGFTSSGRTSSAAKAVPDTASFPGTAGVQAALGILPDSRPDAVSRAQSLINDPNYPSAGMVHQLANHLTRNLSSQNS